MSNAESGIGNATGSDHREEQRGTPSATPALSRRGFLRAAAMTSALAASSCATGPFSAGTKAPGDDMLSGDALDQAARVRNGDVTPVELVQATIDRIEALDGPINAVVTTFYERALARAAGPLPDGPFHGVPFLLKDLNDLAGTPKSMGSRLFEGYVSEKSSPHTEAVLEAGFIVLGKTNTPEFGLVPTTESAALGVCHNPWNTDFSAGGSSGGAAAAVASGMLPIAQASDGGGSIRIPASCCGLFGLKPSRGRNRASAAKRAVDISVKHCISRSVRDTAAYSMAVQRTDGNAPFPPLSYVDGPSKDRLRIGFFTRTPTGSEAHPDVKRSIEETAALCASLGHKVDPADIDFEGEAFIEHFLDLWASVPAAILTQTEERGLDPTEVLEPVTLGLAERSRSAPEDSVAKASEFLDAYALRVNEHFRRYDVLLSPVLRTPPVRIGELAGTLPYDQVMTPLLDYVSYTPIWNATGHPAMSVPLGWSAGGLPIGSHFIAGHGQEARLLALAYELEEARPWADRRPGQA